MTVGIHHVPPVANLPNIKEPGLSGGLVSTASKVIERWLWGQITEVLDRPHRLDLPLQVCCLSLRLHGQRGAATRAAVHCGDGK
jgi:hypothetical protein